jgi:XTP/dITP diphosphohydrolase
MVLLLGEDRYLVAQETVHGTITTAPRGSRGFGYDPLFLVPGTGKTVAELPDEEKDRLSHRGRAARRILLGLGGGG